MKTAPRLPNPAFNARGVDTVERPGRESFSVVAKQYTPKGTDEPPAASVARFAAELLDANGEPYTATALLDAVKAFGASDMATLAAAILAQVPMGTYDGEPTNYAAPNPATAVAASYSTTLTGANNDVVFSAKTAGSAGNDLKVVLVDPAAPNQPLTTALDISTPANPTCTISLATGPGNNATAEVTTSGTAMTVKHFLTSTNGNDDTITFALRTNAITNFGTNVSAVLPSKELAATWDAGTGVLAVALGTAAGVTAAKLTLTESVGASGGSLKIEQRAAYIGSWSNNKVRCQVVLSGISTALSATAVVASNVLDVTVNLATDTEGLPVAASNTDTAIVAAIQAALATVLITLGSAVNASDIFLCSVLSSSKTFSSPNAWVVMGDGTGSNTAGVNALADNTANAVAFLKTAIEALPTDAPKFDVTADGTGHVSGGTTETFAGGGASAAITTTAQDIVDILTDPQTVFYDVATSALFTCALKGTDTGAGVVTALSVQDLAGGLDIGETSAEVLGTPATLGRLATDGTDVWTALTNDPTTAQAGWVKTFTASP